MLVPLRLKSHPTRCFMQGYLLWQTLDLDLDPRLIPKIHHCHCVMPKSRQETVVWIYPSYADFNKNLGSHLKDYLELDERVGITSLRRILFKKGYCVINDILTSRYVENSELERSASDKISTESEH